LERLAHGAVIVAHQVQAFGGPDFLECRLNFRGDLGDAPGDHAERRRSESVRPIVGKGKITKPLGVTGLAGLNHS
jgi:hypothetical protein